MTTNARLNVRICTRVGSYLNIFFLGMINVYLSFSLFRFWSILFDSFNVLSFSSFKYLYSSKYTLTDHINKNIRTLQQQQQSNNKSTNKQMCTVKMTVWIYNLEMYILSRFQHMNLKNWYECINYYAISHYIIWL